MDLVTQLFENLICIMVMDVMYTMHDKLLFILFINNVSESCTFISLVKLEEYFVSFQEKKKLKVIMLNNKSFM